MAKEDPSLIFYLKEITKKPIYGFSKPINDPNQIFGILGLSFAKSVVESFLFSKIVPNRFSLFDIGKESYESFQDQMISRWAFLLENVGIKSREKYTQLAVLFSATVIFCDNLFADRKYTIEEIKIHTEASYNQILERLTGENLFSIAHIIAKKWELDNESVDVINFLATHEGGLSQDQKKIAKLLYLLFFYVVSRSDYIEVGLNDFIELDTEFVMDSVTEFNNYMDRYDAANS